MEITDWMIVENLWDYQVENTLFTYDENEQEQNRINKNNAWLLFKPKFIPFYPKLLELWLTINESLVFWFIDFYLQNNSDKFYFTNEQIGNMFWFWEQNTSNIIKRLKDKWLIETKYRLKANGWKIRFIQKLYSDYNKNYSQTITKVIDNNNKINNNNINIINNNTEFENSEFLEKNNSLSINNLDLKEKEKSCAKKEKAAFAPPTLEEVEQYCQERGLTVNARKFYNYYSAVGWRVGDRKDPMEDWRAKIEEWQDNDKNTRKNESTSKRGPDAHTPRVSGNAGKKGTTGADISDI